MKSFRFLLPLFLVIVLCSFTVHKFYVGVFQINYSEKKNELQITSRLFIDDLEKALQAKSKKKIYLATPKEISETNDMLKNYLAEKLQVKINGTAKNLTFLGKEVEDNVLICYLTIPIKEKIHSAHIYNAVLTDIFPEQQNIVHWNSNGNKKTLLLTDSNPDGDIEF